MNKLVFLLSSERSGSNLLRLIMDAHRDVSAPSSPHLINTLMPMQHQYDCNKRRLLIKHCIELLELRSHGWLAAAEDIKDELYDDCFKFEDIIRKIYEIEALANGKGISFIKDNGNIIYPFELYARYPDASFVYLVRDCRDFALSWLKSSNHSNSVSFAAEQWRKEQENAIRFTEAEPGGRSILLVRYEDILNRPEYILTRICEHIGIGYDSDMLKFNEREQAREAASAYADWKNLDSPLLSKNCNKYLSGLKRKQIKKIEGIAGNLMKKVGYTTMHNQPVSRKHLHPSRYISGMITLLSMLSSRRVSMKEIQERVERARKIDKIRWEAANLTDKNIDL